MARATALIAGLGLGAGLRAGAVARVTRGGAADGDLVLAAEQRVFERDDRLDPHVLATIGTALAAPTLLRLPAKAPEEVGEHVLKVAQDVAHTGAVDVEPAVPREASVPKAVVSRTFVRIAQDCISFGGFLEFLFRIRIIRIAVRMVLEREFAIRALHLLLGRGASDSEHFVIIALNIAGQNSCSSL